MIEVKLAGSNHEGREVEMRLKGDLPWTEVAEEFVHFLQSCGYLVSRETFAQYWAGEDTGVYEVHGVHEGTFDMLVEEDQAPDQYTPPCAYGVVMPKRCGGCNGGCDE